MKRTRMIMTVVAAVALVLTFASCAKPPKAEMDAATAAVAKAEADADVPVYAGDSLAKAKDSLATMQKQATAKKYADAKTTAQNTVKLADKAIADAKANKETTKASAASTLTAVKTALAEAEKAVASAAANRKVKLDIKALKAELEGIKKTIADANTDFNAASFKNALTKAEDAQAKIRTLTSKVADALRETSKKK